MQSTVPKLSKTPFVRIIIPFIAGIFFYSIANPININILLILLFSCFLLLLFYQVLPGLRNSFKLNVYWGVTLNLILFLSGCYYTQITLNSNNNFSEIKKGLISGEICEQPLIKEKTVKVIINVNAINSNNEWFNSSGKLVAYLQNNSKAQKLNTGDIIVFEPNLNDINNNGNPLEFDLKQYLAYHLITHQTFLKANNWQTVSKKTSLTAFSENIRNKLLNILKKYGLKDDIFSVASALTLGYKNELDANIKQAYSSSGAMHILSVSGLHVGVIFLILNFLLFFFKKTRFQKILKAVLILLFLWFYALLTGLSPSVLRASVMFSFIVIGKTLNRNVNIYNSIAASAMLLLLINPLMLFDVGFQLSYLAVIGIVYYYPIIYKTLYVKNKILDKIWALTAVGISAQITTFPLSLYYFHQFPTYFLLTGLIVIPLSSFIIYLTILLFFVSYFEAISMLVSKALIFLVDIINKTTFFIENLPGAVITDIKFNFVQVVICYLLIIVITIYINNKKIKWLRFSLFVVIILLTFNVINAIKDVKQKLVFVYNIKNISTLNFIDGKNNVLFSDIELNKQNIKYAISNNWLELGANNEKIIPFAKLNNRFLLSNLITINNENLFFKNNFFDFYGCKIVAIRNPINTSNSNNNIISVDYIILSRNANVHLSDIVKLFKFKKIIIDSSNSVMVTNKWLKEAEKLNITCFNVSKQGAFSVIIE